MNAKFLFPRLRAQADVEAVLEKWVRDKIVSGAFAEGLRLPGTAEWAKALGVNDRRVQRVLARLAAQGFLERRPRYGTYVRQERGRRTVVILVGSSLVMEHLYHLRRVVELLIEELRRFDYEVEVIDDLFSLLINDFDKQQARLMRFQDRLAQINPAGYVECSFDLSRLPGLYPRLERPLVSFYPTASGGDVYFDDQAFVRDSLRYLASKGRRKVLLVRSAGRLGPIHHATRVFWESVEDFGFRWGMFRELYHGSVTDSMEADAFRWIRQLAASWKTQRRSAVPDCLVVSDDIVMRGLAAGLAGTGVRVPESLLVLTQANEGIRFRYGIPVVRCEIPLRMLAQKLALLLDTRIGKKKPVKAPILLTQTHIEDQELMAPGVGMGR